MKSIHLIKRAFGSFSQSPPSPIEIAKAQDVLNHAEFKTWTEMKFRDQRNSVAVIDRFD